MTVFSGRLLIFDKGEFIVKKVVAVLVSILALAIAGGSTFTWW